MRSTSFVKKPTQLQLALLQQTNFSPLSVQVEEAACMGTASNKIESADCKIRFIISLASTSVVTLH